MTDWGAFFMKSLPAFADGAWVTLQLTFVGLAIGFVLGLAAALARVYGGKFSRALAIGYIELFRGTPLLVQLFIVYYGLPDTGITLSRMFCAFLVLGLNSGAYQAEYLRGSLLAVGESQMMAARSIGLSRIKAIFFIILPQALRLAIPAWSNEPISLLKSSAVTYLITIPDLMARAKAIAADTYNPIWTYLAVGVVYIFMVFVIDRVLKFLEHIAKIPGLELEGKRSHG
jgi:polar amino acid transport system permease protein